MKLVYAVAVAMIAAACTAAAVDPSNHAALPSPPPPAWSESGQTGGSADCVAADLNYLRGQRASEIDMASLPRQTRVIPHGMSVTMEYVEGRMNLELDEQGRVIRISCG